MATDFHAVFSALRTIIELVDGSEAGIVTTQKNLAEIKQVALGILVDAGVAEWQDFNDFRSLASLRRMVATEFGDSSSLNGYQVVDGNGWEDTQRPDSLQKVYFVEDEEAKQRGEVDAPSVRKVLTLTFVADSAVIAHANIGGAVLDVPPLSEEVIKAIRDADPLAGNGNHGSFTGSEDGGADDLDR